MEQEIRQYFNKLAEHGDGEHRAACRRAGTALYRGGIETLRAFYDATEERLLRIRGIGEKTGAIILMVRRAPPPMDAICNREQNIQNEAGGQPQ